MKGEEVKNSMEIWDKIQELRKGEGYINCDTYVSLPRNITKEEVLFLVDKIGHAYGDPFEDCQNDSPTMREMLELHDALGDKITYHGYAVFQPRNDYRLTLEGYEATGLTEDEFMSLIDVSRYADDFNHGKDEGGAFWIYTWWD
jgi:hypothetical protein